MQVFELYFKPKANKSKILDTFFYRPKNLYEDRLGDLLMAGELNNPISKESYLLKNLANAIKADFYGPKVSSPARNLRKALKAGNLFLEKVMKKGDVSWLSNLNFAILSFARSKRADKKYIFNFTIVGKMGVILIHNKQVLDIGKKLDEQEIEPYPLKVFNNIISGSVEQDDKVLVLTEKIYQSPVLNDLLESISKMPFLNEKAINKVLKSFHNNLSGLCFLIHLAPDTKKQIRQRIVFKQRFLIKQLNLKPLLSFFSSLLFIFKKHKDNLKKNPHLKILRFEFIKKIIPDKIFKRSKGLNSIMRLCSKLTKLSPKKPLYAIRDFIDAKKIVLVIGLGALLLMGHFVANFEDKQKLMKIEEQFQTFEQKIEKANLYFNLGRIEEANKLFLEARKKGELLSKNRSPLLPKIFELQDKIKLKLFEINKLTIINEPELFFEFSKTQPLPQKIFIHNSKIYAFGSYFNGFFQLDFESSSIPESVFHEKDKGFSGSVLVEDNIALFSRPDEISVFDNNNLVQSSNIELGFENQELEHISSFFSNLYFWDNKTGQIVKYSYSSRDKQWGEPEFWLKNRIFSEQDKDMITSIIVDGGVWLLKENGQFNYYSHGSLKTEINPEIFPEIRKATQIWTNAELPYIYILEPIQKRIMVFNRQGHIMHQYQSEYFDALKSIAISKDGKTIYLLNGLNIFKINLE